jgi:4-hydroxybenzoate polyprenyltransferase
MAAMPGALPDLKMLALFGCLTIPMRGAACTVNDLFDRNIDNKVIFVSSLYFLLVAYNTLQNFPVMENTLMIALANCLVTLSYTCKRAHGHF